MAESSATHGHDGPDAVSATEHVRRFEAEQRARQDAERVAERLMRLHQVMTSLSDAETEEETIRLIVSGGMTALGAYAGAVARVSGDGTTLELLSGDGYVPEALESWRRTPLDAPWPLTAAIRTGRAYFVESPEEWERQGYGPAWHFGRTRAWAALPLVAGGRARGALALSFESPREFLPDDRTFAIALAEQCAQALERVRLREAERRARAEAEDARARLATILESIADGFFAMDRAQRFTYVNREGEKILELSRDALLGRSPSEIFPPEAAALFDQIVGVLDAAARSESREVHDPFRDRWFDVRVYGTPDGVAVYFRDVTARKKLEEQFRHAQKMEAVGRLAGGIAHDFNNLLTVIVASSKFVLDELREGDPMRADLDEIVGASERAAGLTRQLLLFSGTRSTTPTVLDPNAIIRDMQRMLGRLLGEDIELVTELDPSAGAVKLEPGQLDQIVMNLAVNARDALPEGGRLVIRTATVGPGDAPPEARAGESYVMLTVSDDGCGMDDATRARLFEPFFTTKGPGKGTGLGLSTVYGIVQQARGAITVESRVGDGSTFRVYLPRVSGDAAAAGRRVVTAKADAGRETVLLVEDEDAIRRLARRSLEAHGYTVLEARNGGEAMLLSERFRDAIDVMVTDVVMPMMNGVALAERLRRERPGLRVLFISGYTGIATESETAIDPAALLIKPFTPEVLLRRVRATLDA